MVAYWTDGPIELEDWAEAEESADGFEFLSESLKRFTHHLQMEVDSLCEQAKRNRLCALHSEDSRARLRGRKLDEQAASLKSKLNELEQFLSLHGFRK